MEINCWHYNIREHILCTVPTYITQSADKENLLNIQEFL